MTRTKAELWTLIVAILLFGGLCTAAVTANNLVSVQTPKLMLLQIPTAGQTPQALGPTPGANGTKCIGMRATNTSANPYTLQVSFLRSAVTYVQTTVLVPANSGNTAAAPPLDLLAAANWPGPVTDSDGNRFFLLMSGDQLQVNSTVAMADPAKVSVMASCGDF